MDPDPIYQKSQNGLKSWSISDLSWSYIFVILYCFVAEYVDINAGPVHANLTNPDPGVKKSQSYKPDPHLVQLRIKVYVYYIKQNKTYDYIMISLLGP